MEQKVISMSKKTFRIGDLAKELRVKKFVIRFWEKEFQLKSDRSDGGQRFYTQEDLEKFLQIKDLLYNKKFTIKGAKKQLEHPIAHGDYCQVYCSIENDKNKETFQASPTGEIIENSENFITEKSTTNIINPATKIEISKDFFEKLSNLKEKLINLKENLN